MPGRQIDIIIAKTHNSIVSKLYVYNEYVTEEEVTRARHLGAPHDRFSTRLACCIIFATIIRKRLFYNPMLSITLVLEKETFCTMKSESGNGFDEV